MPIPAGELHCDLVCAPGPDGHWRGWITVRVRASALRPLGLHPDQPTSRPTAPSPPGWWHAAAERAARRKKT
ncbi:MULTISPECIES: hypothetical protein [unclassified Streptomyces]|uniref:hypothetical protein n=1 Tax=unclassified Streptomyces TaxID=2593676 RepID=UPI002E78D2FC|nr:hypothetical protein [Streptomyces sp. JV184]MEE1749552.1 hypothetical protein [Streptomyces sp. JV184]